MQEESQVEEEDMKTFYESMLRDHMDAFLEMLGDVLILEEK